MKSARFCALAIVAHLFAGTLALTASPAPRPATEPFDYFQNSWQVIGLKDYKNGTRVTPQNELVLAGKRKLRMSIGPTLTPLSGKRTKTLLDGWLPIVLLNAEESAVRYEFTLWATPLPTVKDWKAAFDGPVEGENFLNWVRVRARNLTSAKVEARIRFDLVSTNASNPTEWSANLAPGRSAETVFRVPFVPITNATPLEHASAKPATTSATRATLK